MPSQIVSKSTKALEGMCEVRVVSYSPFIFEEIKDDIKVEELSMKNCKKKSISISNQYLNIQKLWNERPTCFRPIHSCMSGDKSVTETVANVVSSIPFIALGVCAPRKNLNCKLYANSLIGVGLASSLYHASRGNVRKYLRWADYTMIAVTTMFLSRALKNDHPKLLTVASTLILPIQPLVVSALNTGMMEITFAKRVSQNPQLKKAHNVHKMSSAIAGALFVAEDLFPKAFFIHAAWHLGAAAALSTCNKLLE